MACLICDRRCGRVRYGDAVNEDLRYAIVSGALSESLRKLIELQVAEQEAEWRLMAVCPLDRLDDVLAEADRRAGLMAELWPLGHDRSPRTAALESVCYDVCRGVLQ